MLFDRSATKICFEEKFEETTLILDSILCLKTDFFFSRSQRIKLQSSPPESKYFEVGVKFKKFLLLLFFFFFSKKKKERKEK